MKANKRIICVVLALLMCLSTATFAVSAEETAEPTNQMYKEIVFEALGDRITADHHQWYSYIYSYNADGSTVDEGETPDYILGFISTGGGACAIVERVIGDYYFISGAILNPYDLGYFICSTKENKCYSLDEAWEYKFPNIESAFAKVGTHVDVADNDLTKYRNKIMSMLGWKNTDEDIQYRCVAEYTSDGVEITEGATADYAVIFAHQGAWTEEAYYSRVGNYRLKASNDFKPGYIVYSILEDKIYTIREAYDKDLPGIEFALSKAGTKVTLYADVFEDFLRPHMDEDAYDPVYGWYSYDELYYYSYQKRYGSTEMFEVTPDFVLVEACAYHCPPANVTEVFDDYVVYSGWGNPEELRYFIYTPKTDNIYTLREAYDMNLEDIMNVFTDYGLGFLLGDMDANEKLTIRDATYVQKALAKFEGFTFYGEDTSSADCSHIYVADFDLSGDVNIKDVTAIQKRLAKIN